MTQEQMIALFQTLSYNKVQKFGEVNFTIANTEQKIVTTINGQVETTNTANAGDYMIVGASGETYVLTSKQFEKNYEVVSSLNGKGVAKVKPQPRLAAEWTGNPFQFTAIWGENMICNTGDYLVAPEDLSEVYRIERETFLRTYCPCFKVGDKVKPSRSCQPLYGDPDFMTITEVKNGLYKTNTYSFWFEEHKLELVK